MPRGLPRTVEARLRQLLGLKQFQRRPEAARERAILKPALPTFTIQVLRRGVPVACKPKQADLVTDSKGRLYLLAELRPGKPRRSLPAPPEPPSDQYLPLAPGPV